MLQVECKINVIYSKWYKGLDIYVIFSTKIKEKPIFITLTQNSGIRVKIKALEGLDLHLLYVPSIMVCGNF